MKKIHVGLIAIAVLLLVLVLWLTRSSPPVVARKVPASAVAGPKLKIGAVPPSSSTPAEVSNTTVDAQYKAFLDAGTVPEPVGLGAPARLVPTDKWKDAGRKSVGAAIQSQFWAVARGDVDYLRTAIALDESSKRGMEMLLEQVPTSIRNQYPTADSLAAFLLASCPALKGYALGTIVPGKTAGTDEVKISVLTLEPGADRFGGGTQLFRRDAAGEWLRVIGQPEISRWREMIKWDKELSKSRVWPASK